MYYFRTGKDRMPRTTLFLSTETVQIVRGCTWSPLIKGMGYWLFGQVIDPSSTTRMASNLFCLKDWGYETLHLTHPETTSKFKALKKSEQKGTYDQLYQKVFRFLCKKSIKIQIGKYPTVIMAKYAQQFKIITFQQKHLVIAKRGQKILIFLITFSWARPHENSVFK